MDIDPTGQDISSPVQLSDHSWPYDGLDGRPTENIPHSIDFSCSNIRCPWFPWRQVQQDKIQFLRTHLPDYSWPYGGPEGRPTENIHHPIDFTCPNICYSRFSWRSVQQDRIYPLWPAFHTTLGPIYGGLEGRVGPPKIYPIQSILLVPIYVILGFHGDRSNRTRYILSGPLLALW